ncbi:hypothetical protein B0H66DRAFT_536757 [Apodospora peruviana]|uniref:Uncharacterized protein n=1 Tax=Apodospora peruviana TaxID=516989 RepID=A0AAE0HV77_9PEZI|nr:hypothetical protein B0H66DRAFT_536757 [Apodospora peruviana]
MRCRQILTAALAGSLSLVAAAPASVEQPRDVMMPAAQRGLRHRTRRQVPVVAQNNVINIQNTQITVVEQNLGVISQLVQIAEQELVARVQAQVALVTQLETIKNNIRLNHFKARFSQVNTVIVTITNIVDARDLTNVNRRYLMNQLRIDNGRPDQELVVYVTEKEEMTISSEATATSASASATASASIGGNVINFDANAPFALLNSSLILPYNTSAPAGALVVDDPANIIFADQSNLLVSDVNTFQNDCLQLAAANSFITAQLQAAAVFASLQQAVTVQLASLQLGGGVPIIPPSVLAAHPDLVELAKQQQAQQQNQNQDDEKKKQEEEAKKAEEDKKAEEHKNAEEDAKRKDEEAKKAEEEESKAE